MNMTDTAPAHWEQIAVYLDDLDQMGIVHYTRYADLLERALVGYLASSDTTFPDGLLSPAQTYEAIREFTITYQAPIRQVGTLDVHFWLERLGRTSLALGFRFQRGETVHAQGRRVSVKVDSTSGRPAAWSTRFREFILTEPNADQENQ
ncbi:MAG TPA: thioesterase family protein [Pseudonocardiaceae bacterium]|jgi:acyl-CoA thioester hydrolase|nr:thioesterase family protein [Pseudonocardiaceae bacterium]